MNRRILVAIVSVGTLVVLGLAACYWMEDAVDHPLSFRILELAPGENGQIYLRYEARNESRFPVDGVFLMKLCAFDGTSEQIIGSSDYAGPGRLRYGESFTDWMHGNLRHLPDAGKLTFTYEWTPVTRGKLREWLMEWTYAKRRPPWLTEWAYGRFNPKEGRAHPMTPTPGIGTSADKSK